jgi:hypothetical protein
LDHIQSISVQLVVLDMRDPLRPVRRSERLTPRPAVGLAARGFAQPPLK